MLITQNHTAHGPIGVFDSGYGGLTVLKEIVQTLPQYDYLYLGDNARAPYGTRSFETVYRYTLEAVQWFFKQGCPLVILACNTASAKALRNIQQQNLPLLAPQNRVLGVIRPTAEVIGNYSHTQQLGILATSGTVQSESYVLEIAKFFPNVQVHQQACPLWVPLIENGELSGDGLYYYVHKYTQALLQKAPDIDTVLLACTHYPLIASTIAAHLPQGVQIISQGAIVAHSLADYLQRHPSMEQRLTQQGTQQFFTTDTVTSFNEKASLFYGSAVTAEQVVSLT
jgi:glutamate racemase